MKKKVEQKGKWWLSIVLMLGWCFVGVIVGQLVIGWPMFWILGAEKYSQPVWVAVNSALSYVVSLLLIVLIPMALMNKWKVDRKELGLQGAPTWTDIGLSPIGFVVATILAAMLSALFSVFPWFDASQTQNVGFSFILDAPSRVLAFVTLVGIAPIAEEIIFRGWLYGLIRKKTSLAMGKVASMVLSSVLVSLLFGLVHLQWNVAVNVFAMSLVLCALREITGTIYAGILMHMLKNGVAFWMIYVLGIMN
jgi:hypothetical protein